MVDTPRYYFEFPITEMKMPETLSMLLRYSSHRLILLIRFQSLSRFIAGPSFQLSRAEHEHLHTSFVEQIVGSADLLTE